MDKINSRLGLRKEKKFLEADSLREELAGRRHPGRHQGEGTGWRRKKFEKRPFITFEGRGEEAVKSTQIKLLEAYLKKNGSGF